MELRKVIDQIDFLTLNKNFSEKYGHLTAVIRITQKWIGLTLVDAIEYR